MFGAILGDIIGSPFEFDRGNKSKDFQFFSEGCTFTDDTVMTVAVAEALMKSGKDATDETILENLIKSMQKWGKKYPDAGYGGLFSKWLCSKEPKPYNSYGNGSAMRVSAAGWYANSIEEAKRLGRLTAEVTHNHPEGIKGAQAIACGIFMARKRSQKDEIKKYIEEQFGYDLSRTCDEIRPDYYHQSSCQATVPEAITAFLEGENFEDVIRTAVSLGGDCDTLTAIAGSLAEEYYGVSASLKLECYKRTDKAIGKILRKFEDRLGNLIEELDVRYEPVFWFSKNEEGKVVLCRPYSKPKTYSDKKLKECISNREMTKDEIEAWIRAKFFMDIYNIWDATCFGCTMRADWAFGLYFDENGDEYRYIFSSIDFARKGIYTIIDKNDIEVHQANVKRFYDDIEMQVKFNQNEVTMLHPIVTKFYRNRKMKPFFIGDVELEKIYLTEYKIFDPYEPENLW